MEPLLSTVGALLVLGAVLLIAGQRRGVIRREAAGGDERPGNSPRPGDPPSARGASWLKYGVFVAIVIGLLILAGVSHALLALALLAVTLRGAEELRRAYPNVRHPVMWLVGFVLVGAGLGHLLMAVDGGGFDALAFVVVIVATMDAFSQLWGQLAGRRRLCPRLSAGKTVEGMMGGLLTVVAASWGLAPLVPRLTSGERLLVVLVTAVAAVLGDLLFSMFKRRAGIKDFAALLPAHGGIMDRFDSLVLAAPAYYWVSRWISA